MIIHQGRRQFREFLPLNVARCSLAGGALVGLFGLAISVPLRAQPSHHSVQAKRPAAATIQEQRKAAEVKTALLRLLHSKVSSPNGKLIVKVIPGARADKGYFSDIFVSGKPAQVKKLRITELTLHASNLRLNVNDLLRDNDVHTIFSNTRLRAVVTEDDLTYLLTQGKSTRPMGLKVKYIGSRMRITGNFHWGWFNGPVVGVGKLRLAPGHKVYFDIISLKLNGAEVPDWLKTKFSDRINPVIDYEDIPFHPQFKSLTFKGPVAILTA